MSKPELYFAHTDIGLQKKKALHSRTGVFTTLIIAAFLALPPHISVATDTELIPAMALDGELPVDSIEATTAETLPLGVFAQDLGARLETFEPPAPMGASPAALIVPTFEDINPDQSTLDASNPNGASAGRCNGLASVAGDNETFYLASEWGGLYRSTDAGLTWDFLPGHMPLAAWDVEVNPDSTSTIYATSFYDGRLDSISGIEVSNDGGSTWAHPNTAEPNAPADEGTAADNTPQANYSCAESRRTEPSAFGIGVRPDAPANVVVGTNCGVAISTDSGVTWQFRDPDPNDSRFLSTKTTVPVI